MRVSFYECNDDTEPSVSYAMDDGPTPIDEGAAVEACYTVIDVDYYYRAVKVPSFLINGECRCFVRFEHVLGDQVPSAEFELPIHHDADRGWASMRSAGRGRWFRDGYVYTVSVSTEDFGRVGEGRYMLFAECREVGPLETEDEVASLTRGELPCWDRSA